MARVIGLDVGDVRIGVAISDTLGILANPYQTYTRTKSLEHDIKYFVDLIAEKQIDTIVCGLPKSMNNTDSIQTGKVRDFADSLKLKTEGIKFVFIDERLTTVSAERILIEGNVRRDKRKGVIDKVAAVIILQQYLDKKK